MFLPWLGGGMELFISSVHYYSTTLLNGCASLGGASLHYSHGITYSERPYTPCVFLCISAALPGDGVGVFLIFGML